MPNLTYDVCPTVNGSYDCSSGLFLPILDEREWSTAARAILYLIGMLYTFLGVSVAADVFMCSIEKITSKTKTRRIVDPETNEAQLITEDVWNPTVANLTLMALGSSAPEILLSIIEIVGNDFKAGALGPSTIVGSAAFNLLVIGAVCIVFIPKDETRRIDQMYVFITTATSSIAAYLWLLFILLGTSKNEVEIWEAVVTLVFFVVLIILAFIADKQFCCSHKTHPDQQELFTANGKVLDNMSVVSDMNMSVTHNVKGSQYEGITKNMLKRNRNMSANTLAYEAAMMVESSKKHSWIYYRLATTGWCGSKAAKALTNHRREHALVADQIIQVIDGDRQPPAFIEFSTKHYGFLYGDAPCTISLFVDRKNKDSARACFKIETIDAEANQNVDFVAPNETFILPENEDRKVVQLELLANEDVDENVLVKTFFVKLTKLDPGDMSVMFGRNPIVQVSIFRETIASEVGFRVGSVVVEENVGQAVIPIVRNGTDAAINAALQVDWETEDVTAENTKDFIGGKGVVYFEPNEMEKPVILDIIDDIDYEKHESFRVHLTNINVEGVAWSRHKSVTVGIISDDQVADVVSRAEELIPQALDDIQVGSQDWRDQFEKAANVNDGNLKEANYGDYVLHFFAFFWKMVFALVPPVSYCGGWLTFFVALGLIGLLTALIGDFAAIFGCLVGLKDSVTAITLVALGTSLPDMFASKLAAVQEDTADSSVGNVTGSNSVNVFLGLGIPWFIASVYWKVKGKKFSVQAGDLAFSVTIYSIFATVAILIFVIRRKMGVFGKAELGGPWIPRVITGVILCILWFLYVLLSSLNAYGNITTF